MLPLSDQLCMSLLLWAHGFVKSAFCRALLLCLLILWDSNSWPLFFFFFFFWIWILKLSCQSYCFMPALKRRRWWNFWHSYLTFSGFNVFLPNFMLKKSFEMNLNGKVILLTVDILLTIHFMVQVLAKKTEHVFPFYLSCCRKYWEQQQQTRWLGLWTTIDFALYIVSQSCCWYNWSLLFVFF